MIAAALFALFEVVVLLMVTAAAYNRGRIHELQRLIDRAESIVRAEADLKERYERLAQVMDAVYRRGITYGARHGEHAHTIGADREQPQ